MFLLPTPPAPHPINFLTQILQPRPRREEVSDYFGTCTFLPLPLNLKLQRDPAQLCLGLQLGHLWATSCIAWTVMSMVSTLTMSSK